MYYVMDAHSFYNFIYFILLIIVSLAVMPFLHVIVSFLNLKIFDVLADTHAVSLVFSLSLCL